MFLGGFNILQSNKYYNHFTLKKYSDDYYKLVYFKYPINRNKKNNLIKSPKDKDNNNNDDDSIRFQNNISRARGKVFEYAISNDFDYFITLTLDKEKYDRYNLSKYIKDLGQMIRNDRRKGYDIQYVLVPEMHQDGAWHLHGLIKGIPSNQLVINKYGYLDWIRYSKKFGYCSIDKIKSNISVSKYITKYINKNLGVDIEVNKKLYYSSKGLKTAKIVLQGLQKDLPFSFDYENEYLKVMDIDKLKFNEIKKILGG